MIGTMVLVLMGCGSAVFAGSVAGTVGAGVGTLGVALAFGLAVVAMAYTIGGISGCHINPAITLGVFLSGRMSGKDAGRSGNRPYLGADTYCLHPYHRYFSQSCKEHRASHF